MSPLFRSIRKFYANFNLENTSAVIDETNRCCFLHKPARRDSVQWSVALFCPLRCSAKFWILSTITMAKLIKLNEIELYRKLLKSHIATNYPYFNYFLWMKLVETAAQLMEVSGKFSVMDVSLTRPTQEISAVVETQVWGRLQRLSNAQMKEI